MDAPAWGRQPDRCPPGRSDQGHRGGPHDGLIQGGDCGRDGVTGGQYERGQSSGASRRSAGTPCGSFAHRPGQAFGSYLRAMPSLPGHLSRAQNRATSTVSGRVGELRGSHAAVVDIRSRECDSTLVSKQPQIHKPARKGGEVHSYGFKTRMLQPAEAERSNAVVMNCCSGDPVNTRSAADLDIAFAEISPGIERWVPGLCKSKLRTVSSSRCPRLVPVGQ